MSYQSTAMHLSIRDRIKTHVIPATTSFSSQASAACELTDNGRPTTTDRGIVFFAVHGGNRTNRASQDSQFYLHDQFNFKVTISVKSANKPRYRFGDEVLESWDTGIGFLTDLVVVSLNGYLGLAVDANTLMVNAGYTTVQPFVLGVAPKFLAADNPVERTASWFAARSSDQGTPMGISVELRFSGLQLIREIGQS